MNDILASSNQWHMIISGKTGSGKTFLMNKLMTDILKYQYDDVYVFTTTYEENHEHWDNLHLEDELTKKRLLQIYGALKSGKYDEYLLREYQEWINPTVDEDLHETVLKLDDEKRKTIYYDLLDQFPLNDEDKKEVRIYKNGVDEEVLDKIFKEKRKKPKERICIIFDDILKQLNHSEAFLTLCRNGRSRGINLLCLTQRMIDLSPDLRSQFSYICYFHNPNDYNVFLEYLGLKSMKEKTQLKNKIESIVKKYSFIFCDLNENDINNKFYLNFEKLPIKII